MLPFVLLGAAALVFVRDRVEVRARTAAGALIIFLSVISLLVIAMTPDSMVLGVTVSEADLARSGGYVGFAIASTIAKAFGKPITAVLLVGVIACGAVLIGFSISGFVQELRDRAERLASLRRIDLNDRPWGDDLATASSVEDAEAAFAVPDAQPRRRGRHAAVPSAFEGAPTAVADQLPTTLLEDIDDGDDDPFVDLSEQLAAESAPTVLVERGAAGVKPVDVRRARASRASSATQKEEVGEREFEPLDALPDADDGDEPPFEPTSVTEGGVATQQAIPAFLLNPKRSGGAGSADANPSGERTSDAESSDPSEPEGALAPSVAPPSREEKVSPSVPARDVKPAGSVQPETAEGERRLPPLSMLRHNPHSASAASSDKELAQTAESLQSTLSEFNLHSRVVGWISGPTVTTFKVQPGEGERVSRISSLEDDIALALAAQSVRIFAPIPGTSLVGIEIPNRTRQTVNLGDVLPYVQGGPLELAIGRDAEGAPIVADLAKMPHLLIAGTTGSGKSVMINAIVTTLLMRTVPEDVRLIMVDPKRVELAGYNGLPHLYVPVVTEPKQAASALQWGVSEMERRLKVFERLGVRNIATFNAKQVAGEFEHYDNPPAKMPYLVIIIDELSDLMMVAGKDVEASIVRIAQLGRAAGIHLIVATQRPSSNVVTGLIKANITNRIAFNVATGVDSRVIIDQMGAEKLTGLGDMLFSKVDWGKPKRIQGCFVSDDEINQVVAFVKEQGEAEYHEEILSAVAPAMMSGGGAAREASDDDPLIWEAARIVVESQLGSTSGLQRRLKVGYARAGRIMDMLEEKGVVGPPDGSKPREVLLDEEGLAELEELEARMDQEDRMGGM